MHVGIATERFILMSVGFDSKRCFYKFSQTNSISRVVNEILHNLTRFICWLQSCITNTGSSSYHFMVLDFFSVRSSENDSTGFWPPGSLHTLGADGHI